MSSIVMFMTHVIILAGCGYALVLHQVLKRIAPHEADYSFLKCVLLTVSMLLAHLLVPFVLRDRLPEGLLWVTRIAAWIAIVFIVKWLAWVSLSKAALTVGIMLALHLLLGFGLDAWRARGERRIAQIPSPYDVYEAMANWEASRLDVSPQLAGILDVMPPRFQVARIVLRSRHEDTLIPSVAFEGFVRGYANTMTAEQDLQRLPRRFALSDDGPGYPLIQVGLAACAPDPRDGVPAEYRMFDLTLRYAPLPLQGHAESGIPDGIGRPPRPRQEGLSRSQMLSLLTMRHRIVLPDRDTEPRLLAAEYIRLLADAASVEVLFVEDGESPAYPLVKMGTELLTGLRQRVGLRGSVHDLIALLEEVGKSPAGHVVKADFQQTSEHDASLLVTIDWPTWAEANKGHIRRMLPPR